ncbi:ComEC/Rec2 family competence protein [Erythrobacter sp. GH1-10]|uniref:ComEC/Rec2 family competence protein n=1 Tax=Erythrobacter sp. GH1-10 TaxID=3349334 RepID=UPI0038783A39
MNWKTISLTCGLHLVLTGGAVAQEPGESDRAPTEGEEVYGGDYVPTPPPDPGMPLFAGKPRAGISMSPLLSQLDQEELLKIVEASSAEPSVKALETGDDVARGLSAVSASIPLRKGLESQLPARPMAPAEFQPEPLDDEQAAGEMTVHFVYTGQGDGAILEFSCGVAVIDVGGEFGRQEGATDGGRLFAEYLDGFFNDRPQFDRTIDVLFFTHPHADHIIGEQDIREWEGEPFKVRNFVDNGHTAESGSAGRQTRFRDWVAGQGGDYTAVSLDRQVTATGVTNSVIDPLECENVDPVITAFWGSQDSFSGDYRNPNNHSLVIRVDFGEASFLFTGDLEDAGEADLREEFSGNLEVFDVDVYQVSHHGADRDTSQELLEIMTPRIAVISMGRHEARVRGTAWDHGHPRSQVVELLAASVTDSRDQSGQFHVFENQETEPVTVEVEKAIYATGWEGTLKIAATSSGTYSIERDGFED